MSDEQEHDPSARAPGSAAPAPDTPEDAGSQALADALRSSFAIVRFLMAALVILFFGSGFFQIGPQEQAVILRFGKPVGGAGPKALLGPGGLHWAFPYPIDEVVRIPIKEIQSVTSTIGWFYLTPEQAVAFKATGVVPSAGGTLNPAVDGYVITADRNIIHVSATLYYQVDDPFHYMFDFVSASNLVQNALNNAVLYTAAHFGADDVLYSDVAGFKDAVQQRAAQLAARERLGITIKQCTVEKSPPRQLKNIFDQVTDARQNRSRLLDEAHTVEFQMTNGATAVAAAIIYEAISASSNYVASIQADANVFTNVLPNYRINPGLYEQRELVRVMGQALTNANFKAYLPTTANGEPVELRLLLNREPPGQRTGE